MGDRPLFPPEFDLQPLHRLIDEAYPPRLKEMAELLYTVLVEKPDFAHLGTERLAQMALDQTERLSQALGGTWFYMHKATSWRLSPRDREICGAFTGDNYDELARRWGLTEMRVRQIVGEHQEAEFRRRQLTLPGTENPPSGKSALRRAGRP